MTLDELQYAIALKLIPSVGDTTAKKLIQHFGSAKAIFNESKNDLKNLTGIGEVKLKAFKDSAYLTKAEEEVRFIENQKIDYTYFKDKNYPHYLKQCIDSPIVLFSRGNIDLQNKKIISIVGTRKITTSGIDFCEKLIENIAPLNPVIVSGFAYGADITAHKAAIKNNLQNIACLAHGLDQIYPKVHKKYMKDVENNGGFMTDFCSYQEFNRNNFLSRNRIIAGISQATIVIESAEKGGSLVTAHIANSYNRDVFAVPGRPTDQYSKGCNSLIKRQMAHLLTDPADIIYHLNWDIAEEKKNKQTQLFVDLTDDEEACLKILEKKRKAELDEIAITCQYSTSKTASILLNLELKGLIRPLPGKQFEYI